MGKTSGIRSSVDEAGRREPCLARMVRAGSHWASYGGGGVRYSDSSVWYMDGVASSGSLVGAPRSCVGEEDRICSVRKT